MSDSEFDLAGICKVMSWQALEIDRLRTENETLKLERERFQFDNLRDLLKETHKAITTGKKKERLALEDRLFEAIQKLSNHKGTGE